MNIPFIGTPYRRLSDEQCQMLYEDALDLIHKVGPDGDFLNTKHLLKHFHSRWYQSLIERENYSGWQNKGGKDLGQRAAKRVDQILAEHTSEPLPKGIQKELQTVVQKAAQKYNH